MWRLVPSLVARMGAAFPELTRAEPLIEETLRSEETRFQATLDRGLRLLDDELDAPRRRRAAARAGRLPPLRHLRLPARPDPGRAARAAPHRRRRGLRRRDGRAEGQGPRRLGRLRRGGRRGDLVRPRRAARADRVPRLRRRDRRRPDPRPRRRRPAGRARRGRRRGAGRAEPDPVLRRVGRPGRRHRHGSPPTAPACAITDVRKKAGLFVHLGRVEEGTLARGAAAELAVDHDRRTAIRANHSATHLLHEALRRALGDHVAQRGSLVAPDRLRFDFAHPKAMTPAEVAGVEAEVNDYVRQNTPVETRIMTPDAAERLGARALFGEKYGDEVRVVSMGARPGSGVGPDGDTYSLELCGGTHVARTGDIGAFKLVAEGATSSGVRRVEALTGSGRARPCRRRRVRARPGRGAAARPPRGASRPHTRPARRAPGPDPGDR